MPSSPNLEVIHELCRLRTTLEAFAAVRLHALADREVLMKKMREILGQLHVFAKRGEYEVFHKTDMRFHRELIGSVALPPLLKSWDAVIAELDAWTLGIKQSHWPSLMALYHEHVFLFEALQSEQAYLAEQAIHQHVEAGWYRLASGGGKISLNINPVDRATSFISVHYASKIETAWIARNVCFVSASQLTRLFRKQLGVSPNRWLRDVRLERASELLSSRGDPMAKVARLCGYKNVSHFTRHFHQKYQMPPAKYRALHLKNCSA